jgi:small subunit ribosomal protein S12
MVTLAQHLRKATRRRPKFHWNRTTVLERCPQKRVVVHRIYTESPKKPNSAKRRVVRARIPGRERHLRVKLPGPGHGNLARYAQVLIRGAHPRDLPGIRYSIIRGKLGSTPVLTRRKGRSKYGLRKRTIALLAAKNTP